MKEAQNDQKKETTINKNLLLGENRYISIEDLFNAVNGKGIYQIIIFIIFFVQLVFSSMVFVGQPFLFEDPIFICSNNQECTQKQACQDSNYTISQSSTNSLTFHFELYCERQSLKSTTQSMVFFGGFLGSFLFSFISDWKGRKIAIILSWILASLGVSLVSISINIYMVMAGLFLAGCGIYPSNTLNFIIMSEQSTGKFRVIATAFILGGYTLSEGVIDGISYAFNNDWKIIMGYFFAIPMCILILTNFYLVESARFYVGKNNEKIIECFNKMAVKNKRKIQITMEEVDFEKFSVINKKSLQTFNYWDLFKYKSIRVFSITCTLYKFLAMFILYGMQFSIDKIGFNININLLIAFLAEVVGVVILFFIMKKLKRKTFCLFFLFFSGLFSLIILFFQIPEECKHSFCYQKYTQITLYVFSRMFLQNCFVIINMYFPELFPTQIRGLALGLIRGVGISGSILSPFALQLSQQIGVNPVIFFGSIGMSSTLCGFGLKETLNQKIEDQIEELKQKVNFDELESDCN